MVSTIPCFELPPEQSIGVAAATDVPLTDTVSRMSEDLARKQGGAPTEVPVENMSKGNSNYYFVP